MSQRANVVLEIPCDSKRIGEHVCSLAMLKEGPVNYSITPEKIRDIWIECSKHDVLFSDYTQGKVEPLVDVLIDPRGVWLEVSQGDTIVGAMYLSDIIPGFDAVAHFAFWDSIASGREPLALFAMEFVMDRYKLRRLTAKIPVYQRGTIRFTEGLGFMKEGTIRSAVPHKGKWMPMDIFGILREELEEQIEGVW